MQDRRHAWRDAVVALSLANLCFLDVWAVLLPAAISTHNAYHLARLPPWPQYAVAFGWLAVMTGVAYLILRGARARHRYRSAAARLALFATLLVAVNAVRLQIPALSLESLSEIPRPLLALATAGAAALVLQSMLRRAVIARATAALALLAPFAAVCIVQAIHAWVQHHDGRFEDRRGAALSGDPVATRVVWVLFDEFDYRLAFEARPDGASLPALDALRRTSLDARQAYPPGGYTAISVPGLLVGRRVESVTRRGPAHLDLRFEGHPDAVSWTETETVFSRLKERGRNVAVVGWYHPYCRLFGHEVASCSWRPAAPFTLTAANLSGALHQQAELLAFTVPGAFRLAGGREAEAEYHAETFRALLTRAERVVADPRMHLVYVHLSVPHGPMIWDVQRDRFRSSGEGSYLENLVLADRAWARLRKSIEEANLWDRTWVLVTSDHAWRDSGSLDRRVPFLLRSPDDEHGRAYEAEFDTSLTAELLAGILGDRLLSLADAESWLDGRVTAAGTLPPVGAGDGAQDEDERRDPER